MWPHPLARETQCHYCGAPDGQAHLQDCSMGVFFNESYDETFALPPAPPVGAVIIPMAPPVQKLLTTAVHPVIIRQELLMGRTPEEVGHDYGLIVRSHPYFPGLTLFKYDQLHSPMGEPLVQQCRGLILDQKDYWATVCRPFDKFFNEGDHLAPPIDWTTVRVQEKLDGTMCCLWCYKGAWHISTLGSPNAGGLVCASSTDTFQSLFWRTWFSKQYRYPGPEWASYTFMFELTTPENRVVVRHSQRDLRLIGVRHKDGGEVTLDRCAELGFTPVQEFSTLRSLQDLVGSFGGMDPVVQEGYVAVDANFRRVKVKHPGYVELHRIRGNGVPTPRQIVLLHRAGEEMTLLKHFPEWTDYFLTHTLAKSELASDIDLCWKTFKDEDSQKAFADNVKDLPYASVLFAMRSGKVASIREAFNRMHVDRLLDLLRPYTHG